MSREADVISLLRKYRALTIVLTGKRWYQSAVRQYKKLMFRGRGSQNDG